MRRALAVLLATLSLALVACSSDSGSSSSTTAASSTTAPAAERAPYAEPGPHQVGVATLDVLGRRTVVWYPAADSAKDLPTEDFDLASLLSPELQAQIPADERPVVTIDAHPGAPAATGGPFPVVLFSHGFAGYPEQSSDITTHLAQWGYVVVAPDHVDRSLDGLLGTAAANVATASDPDVLNAALDAAIAESNDANSPMAGTVDPSKVVVAGHSAGAAAAYITAGSNDRVQGFIAYSLGTGQNDEALPAPPDKPGLVMLGTKDGIIPPATTRKIYATMQPPKWLAEFAGAGHLVFSNICLIGADQGGVVGIAKKLNLGVPDQLLRLGSDGCGASYPDPSKAFPAIEQLSVAFLRFVFGQDPEPVGMTTADVAGLGAEVVVRHQG